MDEVDRANDLVETMAQAAVAAISTAAQTRRTKPTGLCLWCGHIVTAHARWCDAECRDEWEYTHERNPRP